MSILNLRSTWSFYQPNDKSQPDTGKPFMQYPVFPIQDLKNE